MVKYIDNILILRDDQYGMLSAGEFLLDTGLLFEINRRILHPLGLALVAVQNEEGQYELSNILIDCRHIPGGLLNDEMTLALAEESLFKFMDDFGVGKMQERQKLRGFVIQRSDQVRNSENM